MILVHHKDCPDTAHRFTTTRGECCEFKLVGLIATNDFERAFVLTQHGLTTSPGLWWDHSDARKVVDHNNVRSSSVGDIFELLYENDNRVIDSIGFKKVTDIILE